MSKKELSVVQLGKEFKSSKSEKTFKKLYERVKIGVVNYYSNFGKDTQLIEDAFQESMISIWRDIDKLDVDTWSISTAIYMKTRQNIIKHNMNKMKKTGDGNSSYGETTDSNEDYIQPRSTINSGIVSSYHIKESYVLDSIDQGHEDRMIREEAILDFWRSFNDIRSYDLIYDHYIHGIKYKDLAVKYFNDGLEYDDNNMTYEKDIQTVKNRIFHGKKYIKRIIENKYEKVNQIFN